MSDKVTETSRASLVSVTAGMANAMTRGKRIARVCTECDRGVPAYAGRYPSRCPMCKGELGPVEEMARRPGDQHTNPAAMAGFKFIVKWAKSRRARITTTGFKTEEEAKRFLFARKQEGYNGIIVPVTDESTVRYVSGCEPDPSAEVIVTSSLAPTLKRLLEAGTHKNGVVYLPYVTIDEVVPAGVSGLAWFTEQAGDVRYRCESPTGPVLIFEFEEETQEARAYLTDSPKDVLGFDPREEMVEDGGWSADGRWAELDEGLGGRSYYGPVMGVIFKHASYPWWFVPQSETKRGGYKGLWVDWEGYRGRKPRKAVLRTLTPDDVDMPWSAYTPADDPDTYQLVRARFAEKGAALTEASEMSRGARNMLGLLIGFPGAIQAGPFGDELLALGYIEKQGSRWYATRAGHTAHRMLESINESVPPVMITGMAGGDATYTGQNGVTTRTKARNRAGFYEVLLDYERIYAIDGKETAGWVAYVVALQTPHNADKLARMFERGSDHHDAFQKVLGLRIGSVAGGKLHGEFEKLFYMRESLGEASLSDPMPPVLSSTDEDQRAGAFRPRNTGKGKLTRVYGGTRFTVGSRKRGVRKDVEASLQNRLNARRGQAKRIEAAKRWHQDSSAGKRLHRDLGRYNTGNGKGESNEERDEPFLASTAGAQLGIAEQADIVSARDLAALERVLDSMFASAGIDIEFTRHFLDRVNDVRNKRQITTGELSSIFSAVFGRHAKKIRGHGADWEAVIKDLTSAINIPFVLNYNRRTKMIELVAKTVMRKKGFKTRNKELTVQTAGESAGDRVASARSRVAALSEADIDFKAAARVLLDKNKDPGQFGLGYRMYLRELIAGRPVKHLAGVGDAHFRLGARNAMNALIDLAGKANYESVSENFADAYPSNMPSLPADMANESQTVDDMLDAILRRLIVIESTDVLEDVNFDENGSIYLFFDPSLTRREVDEVYRWVQQEQKSLQLVASPDTSLPEETAKADWWVMFLPGTLEEGEGDVMPEPEKYAREDMDRGEPAKQQIVVDAPPTAPEQLATSVDTDKLMKSLGEHRANRWLSAYAE